MSIVLSTSDVEQLARTVELLVSPLDHEHVDHWRAAVNRALSQLVGADSAGFMLPLDQAGDAPFIYSAEHDPAELARYPGFMPPDLPDGTDFWESVLQMKVGGLREMYRGDTHVYLGSAYYREYAGANGAHDTICMVMAGRTRHITDSASIQLWHERPTGPRFGERELEILRILRPAFVAGVETQRRFAGEHDRLIGMLDGLGYAVRVCDRDGRRLHRSSALAELLAADPEADTIVASIDEAVRSARLALAPGPVADNGARPPTLAFETTTSLARYRIVVSLATSLAGAPGPLLLASVERLTPVPLGEEELQRQFGLTPAEARVAVLIGRGLANTDVAEGLRISPHTARRHTERVLLKLGVRSRAEAAALVVRRGRA